jgi:hypothetical protein
MNNSNSKAPAQFTSREKEEKAKEKAERKLPLNDYKNQTTLEPSDLDRF